MLKKIDVSNQVTGLRPKIKQAVVHLAHHLTREIAKCEKRKGKKADKFHKKAETFRKEVLLLKEIDPDVVSRYALMMEFSEREKLLGDINLPLDTKVMVKLSTAKPVVSHIETFRAAHSDWRGALPELLDSLGSRTKHKKEVLKQKEESDDKPQKKKALSKSSKTESEDSSTQDVRKKKEKSAVVKIQKNVSLKKPVSLAEQVTEGEVNEDEDKDNTSDTNGDKSDGESSLAENYNVEDDSGEEEDEGDDGMEEDDDGEEGDEEDEEEGDEEEDEDENGSDEGSEEEEEMSELEGERVPSKTGISDLSKNKNVTQISSASKFAEVRRFADLQLEEEQKTERKLQDSSQDSDKCSENELSDKERGEEDTFFMTGDNRFLKTVAVKRDNGEGLTSNKSEGDSTCPFPNLWTTDGKNLRGNRAQRRAKFLGQPLDKRQLKKLNRKNDSIDPRFSNKNGGSFNKFSFNTEMDSDKKNFRNQKFADKSDNSFGRRSEFPKTKENLSGNKRASSHLDQADPEEKLHPSWEAKRKQKVSLDNFQGKKIKFDDD